jgi:hypothetical protein
MCSRANGRKQSILGNNRLLLGKVSKISLMLLVYQFCKDLTNTVCMLASCKYPSIKLVIEQLLAKHRPKGTQCLVVAKL